MVVDGGKQAEDRTTKASRTPPITDAVGRRMCYYDHRSSSAAIVGRIEPARSAVRRLDSKSVVKRSIRWT